MGTSPPSSVLSPVAVLFRKAVVFKLGNAGADPAASLSDVSSRYRRYVLKTSRCCDGHLFSWDCQEIADARATEDVINWHVSLVTTHSLPQPPGRWNRSRFPGGFPFGEKVKARTQGGQEGPAGALLTVL